MGMDVYGKSGNYFRANIWSWRPIHKLCETVLHTDLPLWGSNGGAGFTTQEACDDLANRLEKHLRDFPNEAIELESDCRVADNGQFLRSTTAGRTAYSTDREHVAEFIKFLRECGGSFEIL